MLSLACGAQQPCHANSVRSATLFLATSPDLLTWRSLGSGLTLAPATHDNVVDVPQLIASPPSWSTPVSLRDSNGVPLRQGNTFVAHCSGQFYMAFDAASPGNTSRGFFMRSSSDLISGWSVPRQLNIDPVTTKRPDPHQLVLIASDRWNLS